jgi:hypothetical protein
MAATPSRPVSEVKQMGLMIRNFAEINLIAAALESYRTSSPGDRTVVLEDLRKRVSSLQTYFKQRDALERIRKASERRNAQTRKIGPSYE